MIVRFAPRPTFGKLTDRPPGSRLNLSIEALGQLPQSQTIHTVLVLEETMGDTQVAGNLSVHWLVNADDVDPVDEETYIRSTRPGRGRGYPVRCGLSQP